MVQKEESSVLAAHPRGVDLVPLWLLVLLICSLCLLWPPYVIGQAIIFLPCGSFCLSIYLLFFLA